jgi:hypothetical protein
MISFINDPNELKGRRAPVTGRSRGIGGAIVRRLLSAGARAVAVARNPVEHFPADAAWMQRDVSSVEGVQADGHTWFNSQNSGNSQDCVTPISFSTPVFSGIQLGTRLHCSRDGCSDEKNALRRQRGDSMPWINLTVRRGTFAKEVQHAVMAKLTDALMFWEKIPDTAEARKEMKGWVYQVDEDSHHNGGRPHHKDPFYFIEVSPSHRL